MVVLLPRLPGPPAEAIVRRFLELGPEGWLGFDANNLPGAVRFAATGGTRISSHQLVLLREGLTVLATTHGFGSSSGRSDLAQFDANAAAWIVQHELFASGEVLRDDVWNFIGAVVAPDIVHWRFGAALERYVGGVRNTFQRLWMRGRALDRGADHSKRWQLLEDLTEDALVQITERPSIGGDPLLARAIGEGWLRAARHIGKAAMEPVMRRAVLRLRIKNEIRSLSELPVHILVRLVDDAFGTPPSEVDLKSVSPSGQGAARMELAPSVFDKAKAVVLTGATAESSDHLREAVDRVYAEAERRGWLSSKSRSALKGLKGGTQLLGKSERNALEFLLRRMTAASAMPGEASAIGKAISV